MQNFNFDRQVQSFSLQLISALSALAPIIIIGSMLGAFGWLGYVDYLYFKNTLPTSSLAVLAAIFLQSMRFGTALGSVRMFRNGKIAGILFLAASLLLTYLESAHVIHTAASLGVTPEAKAANTWLIRIAVWSSVGLELLVAVLFNSMYSESASEAPREAEKGTQGTVLGDILSNGKISTYQPANFTKAQNGLK